MQRFTAIKKQRSNNAQAGFTLIEISFSLIVVGLFIAAFIPLYKLYIDKTRYVNTQIKQKHIDVALESFKNLRGRYPCPAREDAKPSDADYGKETECYGSTKAPGTCFDGICYEQSERQIDLNGTMVYPRVERGALPFFSLGLTEDESYDEYLGRFSYAVTELLTDKTMFRLNRGGISVVNGSDASVINPEGSAHYFVFSHGPDNIGAYSQSGVQMSPCNGPMLDNENCNTSSAHPTARYRFTQQSTVDVVDSSGAGVVPGGGGAAATMNTHYDDFANFIGIGVQPLWEIAEDSDHKPLTTANLHDSVQNKVIIAGGDKAVNMSGTLDVHIAGDAKIRDQAMSEKICDEDDTLCMQAAAIGSFYDEDAPQNDPLNISCPKNTSSDIYAPSSIGNSKINCTKVTQEIGCPDGQIMYGISAGGMTLCRAITNFKCPTEKRDICGVMKDLPDNAAPGSTITLTGGASYSQIFTCSDKFWRNGPSTGVCNCNPGSTTATSSCGPNMSGQVTTTTTTTCPDGKTTTTNDRATACHCVGSSTTSTQSCGPNNTGIITNTTTVTCNGNTATSSTTQTGNTCTCVVNSGTKQVNCPSGWTGKVTQNRTSSCPSGDWGNWTDAGNTCQCQSSYDQTVACAAQYNIGAINQTCSYDCSKGYTQNAPLSCVTKSNTCKCVPSSAITYKACGDGYTGNVKVTTSTICPGNTASVVEDRSACTPVLLHCTVTAYGSPYIRNLANANHDGDVCTYTAGDNHCLSIKYCDEPAGGNTHDTYACKCE